MGNIIENNSLGVGLGGQAQPTLRFNTVRGNTEHGIAYFDDAGGVAERNTIEDNGFSGIMVEDQAQPTLRNNILNSN